MVRIRGRNRVRPCTSIDSTASTPYRDREGNIIEEVIIPPKFNNEDDENPMVIGHLIKFYERCFSYACKKCSKRFRFQEELIIHEQCSHPKKRQTNEKRLSCQQSSLPFLPPPEPRFVPHQAQAEGIGPSNNGGNTLDLSLRLGHSWSRTGPLDEGSGDTHGGPTRVWLWIQEYKMALDLVEGDVIRLMNITGGLENVVPCFQTLSDEELELKL